MTKLITICLFTIIIGIPLNQVWQFFMLLAVLSAVLLAQVRDNIPWKSLVLTGLMAISLHFYPELKIEEGDLILASQEGHLIEPESLLSDSDKIQYAFSADGVWQHPKYSRVVNKINVNGLTSAKLGTINDNKFNFYEAVSPLKRDNLSFLLMYILPPESEGMTLSWKGASYWPKVGDSKLEKINAEELNSRTITADLVNKPIYFAGEDLKINLDQGMKYKILSLLKISLIVIFLILALSQIFKWSLSDIQWRNKATLLATCVAIQLAYIFILSPDLIYGLKPLEGGADGLVFFGYARRILENLVRGNFYEALKSPESVFYFMPGMRYMLALSMSLFGDTYYGYTLLLCFVPLIIYAFLQQFFSKKISIILFIIFLSPIGAMTRYIGLSDYFYIKSISIGYGEALSYVCFLSAIYLLLRNMSEHKTVNHQYTFWAHFLCFIAIFLRPNVIIASLILIASYALFQLKYNKSWQKDLLYSLLGFVPILLIPLHNWYFGGVLVPLTSSATIPGNLPTPPSTYCLAFESLCNGQFGHSAITQVINHWNEWIGIRHFYKWFMLIITIYYAFKAKLFDKFGIIARMALMLQLQMLFFMPSNRYAYISWLFCFMASLNFVVTNPFNNKWITIIKNKFTRSRSANKS